MFSQLRRNVWIVEGAEKTTGERVTLFFSGQLENKNYLTDLLYAGDCREQFRRAWLTPSLRRSSESTAGGSIAVVECTRLPRAPPLGTFHIPCWVGGEIEFAVAARRQQSAEPVKADLRRIRRGGFDFLVERSGERMLRFYDEMYVPYVRAVYGSRAFLTSRKELAAQLARAELVLVRQGGEPVAGEILLRESDRVRSWLIGVKDGDRRYVVDGAIAAIYHFTIRLLAGEGFDRMHAGASRPFLNDGVLRFKAKLGMRLVDRAPKWFALRPLRYSSAVHAFLVGNPFLFEAAGRFYGALFAESRDACPTAQRVQALQLHGMAGFIVFRPPTRGRSHEGWSAGGFIPRAAKRFGKSAPVSPGAY